MPFGDFRFPGGDRLLLPAGSRPLQFAMRKADVLSLKLSCDGHVVRSFYLMGAQTAMGNPLSKAWEGGDCDVLWETEEVTQSEVPPVSGKHVLIAIKVRLQAFPTGLPMSVRDFFCIIEVYSDSICEGGR
jgi:hypothetical protein